MKTKNANRNSRRGRAEPDEDLYFGQSAARKHQRKDQQLSEQTQQAISLALAALGDSQLNTLWVMEVHPFPHAGRMRVVLQAPAGADLEELSLRIEAVSTRLRSEVASSIHRKKVPSLSFLVLPELDEDSDGGLW